MLSGLRSPIGVSEFCSGYAALGGSWWVELFVGGEGSPLFCIAAACARISFSDGVSLVGCGVDDTVGECVLVVVACEGCACGELGLARVLIGDLRGSMLTM